MKTELTVVMSSQPLETKGINDSADKSHLAGKVASLGLGYKMSQQYAEHCARSSST